MSPSEASSTAGERWTDTSDGSSTERALAAVRIIKANWLEKIGQTYSIGSISWYIYLLDVPWKSNINVSKCSIRGSYGCDTSSLYGATFGAWSRTVPLKPRCTITQFYYGFAQKFPGWNLQLWNSYIIFRIDQLFEGSQVKVTKTTDLVWRRDRFDRGSNPSYPFTKPFIGILTPCIPCITIFRKLSIPELDNKKPLTPSICWRFDA